MIVQARCIKMCWGSTQAKMYFPNGGPLPGGLYDLDLSKPADRKLCDLKNEMKEFIFQFDRQAANSAIDGLFFCKECGLRSETLNAAGTHSRSVHKARIPDLPEPKPEDEGDEEKDDDLVDPLSNSPGDRRGKVPVTCKGCGQTLENIGAMSRHKLSCIGRPPEIVPQEVSVEVAQVPQPA
jgi:hypothetical protein